MKKTILPIISVLCMVVAVFVAIHAVDSVSLKVSQQINDNRVLPYLLIDAGHGGEDGGAVAADGTIEKHINLSIARQLYHMSVLFGVDCELIRKDDAALSDMTLSTIRERKMSDIQHRLDIVNSNKDSVLVSIHQNQFADRSCKGLQVFYSPNHNQSMLLADNVQQSVQRMLQIDNMRKSKAVSNNIYLLYHTQNPAIMIECGFLSNPEELALLKDATYGSKLVLCILNGLINCYSQNT